MIISSSDSKAIKASKTSKILKEKEFTLDKEVDFNPKLRPQLIKDFIGQNKIKNQLQIILESSLIRGVLPEHILFYGQPGLGKTTLASLISSELGAGFKVLAAPSLQKQGDLVTLLLNLEPKTILFIDEIHRLRAPLEETLYTAMEDKQVDLVMGKGAGAQSARLDLPEFTLVGATTQLGKISKPLKDRFPSILQLDKYSDSEVLELIERNADLLGIKLNDEAKVFLCRRCRGVPRVTNNLLKRLLDFQVVRNIKILKKSDLELFLGELGVFENGLTHSDIIYLKSLINGTKSLNSLAGILMEEAETIEQVVEPYLTYLGFIDRNSSGRILTSKGQAFIANLYSS